jgi:hypothetical protein
VALADFDLVRADCSLIDATRPLLVVDLLRRLDKVIVHWRNPTSVSEASMLEPANAAWRHDWIRK